MARVPGSLLTLILAILLVAGCSMASDASKSLRFDAGSDKAIVVIGTSVNGAQVEGVGAGRSLETYWQQYDPDSQQLLPGGKTFLTKLGASVFSEPEYTIPTVSVLEIDPGDYALIGAGFPHLMTLYVRSNDPLSRFRLDNPGQIDSWNYNVDPRMHIDPEAKVDPRKNVLFSVKPGQVVYIGHFRFAKPRYTDTLVSIDYTQDEATAREALKEYPGITGDMTTLNLSLPTEQAAR